LGDPVGKKVGRFEVEDRLGAGGMGEVFSAHDPQLHRRVAIKRLAAEVAEDPDLRATLLREARNAARITNQRVAALYDVIEEGEELYLVMEYVEGVTLRERLAEGVPEHEFFEIALQCVEGLAAAHQEGIVHGDIKPDNIMLGPRREVKLLDFGVSRLAVGSEDATYMSTGDAGEVGGTITYMAPEILMGRRSDHRADIFALGVVFYEMLTGFHPFRAPTPMATCDRIIHEAHVPLSQVNPGCRPGLQPVVDKMLAKNPDERYATVDDLAVDLRNLRAELTNPAVRPATTPPGRSNQRSLSLPVTPILLLLAVLVVAVVAWMGRGFFARTGEATAPVQSATAAFDASEWIIAVLPPDEGAVVDAELTAVTDGLVATLATRLTQLTRSHGLQVVPTAALRESGVSGLAAARRELGVTLALTLDARVAGERVRVNIGLNDTGAVRQLDADTVMGTMEDLIALEEQVALRVLRMLRVVLLPMEEDLLRAGTEEPRAHAYYVRGRGYLEEADDATNVDTAADLFEQALRADPGYARAHAGLGRALWRKFQFTGDADLVGRATEACLEAVTLDERDAAGHTCLGLVYNGTGRYEEAIVELEEANSLEPTDDSVYIELANAYVGAGQVDRAEATYEMAIAVRPHYWAGYSWLGTFLVRHGRVDEGIAAYEEATRLAPDRYQGYRNLGAAYYYAERWTDARRAFERALELNPEYSSALSNIGTMYFYEGRYADSARAFERATAVDGQDYLWWGNLGDAYHWAPGERAKAADAYRRAIELAEERLATNANDAEVLQDAARYYVMVGDAEAARAAIARALDLAPSDIYVLRSAAVVHVVLEEPEEAIRAVLAAIEGGDSRAEISVDPMFAELRQDPRLREALESR
jgi:serine/threonine-protein kinase